MRTAFAKTPAHRRWNRPAVQCPGGKKENTDWTHTIGCAENMRKCLDTTMFPDMVQKEIIFFPRKTVENPQKMDTHGIVFRPIGRKTASYRALRERKE